MREHCLKSLKGLKVSKGSKDLREALLASMALVSAVASAQTEVQGVAALGGGLGTATPWGADVSLDIKNDKLQLKPYVGIKGITKDASEELETLDYTYRSGQSFTSHTDLQSKGYTLTYGTELKLSIDTHNSLSLSLDALHRNMESAGEMIEGFVPNPISSKSSVPLSSSLLMPVRDANEVKAEAAWQITTQRPGESFTLRYGYERVANEREMHQYFASGEKPLPDNSLHTKASTQTHSATLEWLRPLVSGQSLTLGARYEDKRIKSDDRQQWNGLTNMDEHFHHTTQTSGLYAGYLLKIGPLTANARLEYDYTEMWDKKLHDFVPQARLQWNINPSNSLTAMYVRRIIRPYLEVLNPARVIGPYTVDYGNPNLEGTHVNLMSLVYQHKAEHATFTATAQHIRVEDGFNAIWMVNESDVSELPHPMRVSTWGNQGVRRAWSVAPEVQWTPVAGTKVTAKATLLWDKRIAYAINMAKEHWGITTEARLDQQLAAGIRMALHADYSEGNTIDLYSHAGRSMDMGAELSRTFCRDKLTATLAYTYREYARTILTQGAYVGTLFHRPDDRQAASITLNYKL